MPVPTLQNFGVPLGNGQRGGILMPKVKNRFRVLVFGFGGLADTVDFTRQVISASRPNVSFPPQEAHSYNSVAYYAGKASWEPITVTVRDDITNSVAQLVGAQVQRQMNFFDQTVPVASGNFKFTMWVETMDGGNNGDNSVLETWVYEGCFLASANYEGFDYSSSDAMTIEMSVRYDNATQAGGLMPETGLTFISSATVT
jgi:hypothetical protein